MSHTGAGLQQVAIIGIGCRFPGGVVDAASFWQLLSEGRDAIGEIPADRIDLAHYFDPRPATPGRIMTRWGGFLPGIEDFDAAFFGISPREAERLDPQQRLVLETAWEALEDGGQDINALQGSRTGVFVGQWLSDFEGRLFADPEGVDFFTTTGSGRYATSGRLSCLLGLQGPSLTLDTACSSSLVAIHLAARALRSGECGLALAGGVNVILQPQVSIAYSQSRMMAPDGRCKFGDAAGDGYVRSEGAAIVLLKPLAHAMADGDRIYAVIRGGAVNNDGHGSGSMGSPSRAGQEALLRTAYADAQVAPGIVGYIEAHGTGTRAGDPVELGALATVLGEGRAGGSRARVGSVKTNIGHTEGAAGAAGLIKLALCLHHGAIPASLHCREPNPAVPWGEVPLEIAREHRQWQEADATGGVSAFGIAGTNAHLVLQKAPRVAPAAAGAAARGLSLLPLSARAPEALRALAACHAAQLRAAEPPSLARLCGAAAHSRSALEQRAVLIAADRDAMRLALERFAAGEPAAAQGTAPAVPPRIAYVVPGQGAQWQGMARQLLATEPVFRASMQRCDAAARGHAGWSMLEQLALEPDAPGYLLDRIDVIQPVLVALAIAYAEWLAACGVRPDAVVGHSMGEVGAAYLAGALDLDTAMRVICRRSALMRATSGRGAMALVDLSMADAQVRIGTRTDRVAVAVGNSPRSSVISGEPAAVDAILAECEREGVFCRRVKVDVASHSPQMDAPAAQLREELADLAPMAENVALYSTVLAQPAAGGSLDAGYWARNMRQPVRFGDTIARMIADGISVFVELGPHPVLLPAIQQTAQSGAAVLTIACARREEPEQHNLLAAAAALWAAGVAVDWQNLQPYCGSVELPRYPWQRQRYWMREAAAGARAPSAHRRPGQGSTHPLLGAGTQLAGIAPGFAWDVDLAPRRNVDVAQHRLFGATILPASLYLELGFAALRAADAGAQVLALRDLEFERPLHLSAEEPPALQLQFTSSEGATHELAWYGDGGSGWIRHARARVAAADGVAAEPAPASASTPRGEEISGADFYAALAQRGAAFGAELAAVQRCWPTATGWVAEIADAAPAQYRQRVLPPAVLDACFQLAAWSAPAAALWLPARVDSATLLRAPRGALRLELRTEQATGGELRCHLRGVDADGAFLLLSGITLRRPGSAAVDPAGWHYQVGWHAAATPAPAVNAANRLVILGGGTARTDALAAALADGMTQAGGSSRQLQQLPADLASLRAGTALELIDLRPLSAAADAPPLLEAALHATVTTARQLQLAGIPARMWLVTANACAVADADRSGLQPLHAAFWGLGAALAGECGDIWGGCIDLGAEVDARAAGRAIAARCSAGAADFALRADGCFERQLQRITTPLPRPARFLPDATYLVTGGCGDLGRQVTRWMVEQGARRLLILGRRTLPERRQWRALQDPAARIAVDHIRALEALGATVHYQPVDVADFDSLATVIDEYAAADWPAIRGVVHLAGAAEDRLATNMQPDDWHPVLAGKACGAWQLHRLLPHLDLFVMFSSMAALLPEPGQASYAAANAVLDAIGAARNAGRGPHARDGASVSIGWGIWNGLGMMAGPSGEQKLRQIGTRGVHAFTPAEGLQQLQAALGSGHAHLLVMPVDWKTYAASRTGRVPAIVKQLGEAAVAHAGGATPATAALQPAERRQQLETGVRAVIAQVLKIPAARIDARKPLGSMGLSSLLAMELRNGLEALVQRPLSATLAWNYPTVQMLVSYLAGEDDARVAAAPAQAAVPATPDPALDIGDLGALSDDQAALLLMRHD